MLDQLRKIVLDQKATPYTIAKQAGIDKSAISRFINGGSLSTRNVQRLFDLLDIKLVPTLQVAPATRGRPRI